MRVEAVTFAAGLAAEGYKPFCAIYSTFLQRAYDQIVHDVAIQRLPVRFAIDRAGIMSNPGKIGLNRLTLRLRHRIGGVGRGLQRGPDRNGGDRFWLDGGYGPGLRLRRNR